MLTCFGSVQTPYESCFMLCCFQGQYSEMYIILSNTLYAHEHVTSFPLLCTVCFKQWTAQGVPHISTKHFAVLNLGLQVDPEQVLLLVLVLPVLRQLSQPLDLRLHHFKGADIIVGLLQSILRLGEGETLSVNIVHTRGKKYVIITVTQCAKGMASIMIIRVGFAARIY